jgi:hypothetical protein
MNHTLSIVAVLLLASCQQHHDVADLQGSWKIDSVGTFYNGFTMTTAAAGDEPLQHYEPEGKLRMTQGAEFRYFLYELRSDTLTQFTTEYQKLETFTVIGLDADHLVLQKEKKPLFAGKEQRRYETRYYSKVQ